MMMKMVMVMRMMTMIIMRVMMIMMHADVNDVVFFVHRGLISTWRFCPHVGFRNRIVG